MLAKVVVPADLREDGLPPFSDVLEPHPVVPERLGPLGAQLLPQPPRHHPPEPGEEVRPVDSLWRYQENEVKRFPVFEC